MSRHKFWQVPLAACCLTLAGCSTVAAGAAGKGTYQYLKGEHLMEFNFPYDKVWGAIEMAIKQLRFEVSESKSDGLNGEITAQRYMGQKVYIEVKRLSLATTQVGVRLDGMKQKLLPDQTPGALIMETIGNALTGQATAETEEADG